MEEKKISVGDVLLAAHNLIYEATVEWALDKGVENEGAYYISGVSDLCQKLILVFIGLEDS